MITNTLSVILIPAGDSSLARTIYCYRKILLDHVVHVKQILLRGVNLWFSVSLGLMKNRSNVSDFLEATKVSRRKLF